VRKCDSYWLVRRGVPGGRASLPCQADRRIGGGINPVIVHEAVKHMTIVNELAVRADDEETANQKPSLENKVRA
jgi:hypothetical protein